MGLFALLVLLTYYKHVIDIYGNHKILVLSFLLLFEPTSQKSSAEDSVSCWWSNLWINTVSVQALT